MEIIIHCSMSWFGNAAVIDSWHREDGYDCIGYHFIITNGHVEHGIEYDVLYDGIIESGRYYKSRGAHVKGHNRNSIGICLVGMSGQFTTLQLLRLKDLVYELNKIYPDITIKQHSDYDSKKSFCAGLTKDQMNDLIPLF